MKYVLQAASIVLKRLAGNGFMTTRSNGNKAVLQSLELLAVSLVVAAVVGRLESTINSYNKMETTVTLMEFPINLYWVCNRRGPSSSSSTSAKWGGNPKSRSNSEGENRRIFPTNFVISERSRALSAKAAATEGMDSSSKSRLPVLLWICRLSLGARVVRGLNR